MRAQRRHELQQNKLAEWTAKVVQRVRPHVNKILLGAVALLAAIVIASVWRAYATRGRSAAWETLFAELSRPGTAGLETLADETPNAPPGHWAALVAAERHLAQGSRLLFTNKENATPELQKAVAAYDTAIGPGDKGERELLEQAYFGRAKAYESLAGADLGNRDDLDRAIADYTKLLTRWPNGPYSAAAKRQLDVLSTDQGKKLYEKLAAYTPKPLATRQTGRLPSLEELRKAIPDDGEFSKPLLEDILKGLDSTAAKSGTGTPTAGKTQPLPPELPKTPAKPEPARAEPPKASPTSEPVKAAPAKPDASKPEPAKPEPAKK
jgi:tetratricopeptide (TPR) repeat protein